MPHGYEASWCGHYALPRERTRGGIMRRESYTAEAIQQAIAQGAITEAYQADPQQVIQELNRLRATEVTSYLQYKQHAYMAVSLFAPGLKADFEAHATLELQHADLLAQRIQQLGGVPDRKSTRLNSSHGYISYAVFRLKKKLPETTIS